MKFVLKIVAVFFCYFPLAVYAESHHPQAFLDSVKGTKDEGMQIVNHFCINCHARKPLINLGAPRIHEESDWLPRVKQGISQLLQHTEEGFKAMPARGGCFECSDEQLGLAILALLPDSLGKMLLNNQRDHK